MDDDGPGYPNTMVQHHSGAGTPVEAANILDEMKVDYWNKLPAELKLKVMESLFPDNTPVDRQTYNKQLPVLLSVLLTSKDMYDVAHKISFSRRFEVVQRYGQPWFPPDALTQHMTHISITLEMWLSQPSIIVEPHFFDCLWTLILRPNQHHNDLRHWKYDRYLERKFPKLRSLHFNLSLLQLPHWHVHRFCPITTEDSKVSLQGLESTIDASKVTIKTSFVYYSVGE